jgi:hypothetical protein
LEAAALRYFTTQWNCWKRSFAGDSTVPRVKNGLDAGAWRQGLTNQSSFKLNEHGPVLNVFWSRRSGMGAGGGVDDFAAGAQAGESKSCTEEKTNQGA